MSRLLLALAFVAATAVILVLLTHSIWPFDATLAPTPQTVTALKQMRDEPKFADLPGEPAAHERALMEPLFNGLLDELISGLERNPRRSWVLSSMRPTVREFYLEDTEVRERGVAYLERILRIVGIDRVNCAFCRYLIFI
jgi:hypothetical protein